MFAFYAAGGQRPFQGKPLQTIITNSLIKNQARKPRTYALGNYDLLNWRRY